MPERVNLVRPADVAASPFRLQRSCVTTPAAAGLPRTRDPRIGAIDDPLERQADRVAEAVLAGSFAGLRGGRFDGSLRRKCAACAETKGDPAGCRSDAGGAIAAVGAGGAPLPADLRRFFEPRFGQDFSTVRVHSDAAAGAASRAIGARAFTYGTGIGFAPGAYAPATRDGRRLIAHELAHVVQQGPRPRVQRQPVDDLPTMERPRLPGLAPDPDSIVSVNPDTVANPTLQAENGCPRPPTWIGNITPSPACREQGEEIGGIIFEFCRDSDIFRNPADLSLLRSFASERSGTIFHVRTYASREGPGGAADAEAYNRNLSCHRLNRMIRELVNLGVQERQIDGVSMGPTDRFGRGAHNRIAVVDTESPERAPTDTGPGRMTMEYIRDAAVARIAGGDYPLAADGYVARWTCGRWRTLSELVARNTILLDTARAPLADEAHLGLAVPTGPNTIILARRIEEATDPIGCAANRIVDLTFHHASRPVVANYHLQHEGGRHLVHLAGLPACNVPDNATPPQMITHSAPAPADPFGGRLPRCADTPLDGPMTPGRGPAAMERPPLFIADLSLASSSGSVGPTPDDPASSSVGVEPRNPFVIRATVDAGRDPAIADYQIGLVQTAMGENWTNVYADGRRERRRLPLPLRDGPPRGDALSDPPWFDSTTRRVPTAGLNQLVLHDTPNFRAFRFLPDLPSSQFYEIETMQNRSGATFTFERPRFTPAPGPAQAPAAGAARDDALVRTAIARNNVPIRGLRAVAFNTWVVARRRNPPAPATHGATEFLAGLRTTFRLFVDWLVTPGGRLGGVGTYNMTERPATGDDAAAVQLRGATPLDFSGPNAQPLFPEFLDLEPPVPRTQALGLDRGAYMDSVRAIADPFRKTPRLRGYITVAVLIDQATGHLVADTPDLRLGAVEIRDGSTELRTPEALGLAQALYPALRRLVAAPSVTRGGSGAVFRFPIVLLPL